MTGGVKEAVLNADQANVSAGRLLICPIANAGKIILWRRKGRMVPSPFGMRTAGAGFRTVRPVPIISQNGKRGSLLEKEIHEKNIDGNRKDRIRRGHGRGSKLW
jgi:hypothetical protein